VETAPNGGYASTTWDRTTPTTTASISGYAAPSWNHGPVTVTLNSNDQTASTSYQVDSAGWVTYSGPFVLSGQGAHSVQYFSSDVSGNVESTRTLSVKIDSQGPSSVASLNGNTQTAAWYHGNVTITLNGVDQASGVRSTVYRLDSSAGWSDYSNAFVVSMPGRHTLVFESTDNAGNAGAIGYSNFSIETTVPASDAVLSGKPGMNDWYVGTIDINITANDSPSGIAAIYYRLDGGNWTVYAGEIVVTVQGNHTLDYYSVDNAGNIEPTKSVPVKIDTALPTVTFGIDPGDTVRSTTFSLEFVANDSGSGISMTEYRLDDLPYVLCSGGQIDLSNLSEGQHTISMEIMDQAGHAVFKELTFTVDTSNNGSSDVLILVGVIVAIGCVAAVVLLKRFRR
jgi:cytochrome c